MRRLPTSRNEAAVGAAPEGRGHAIAGVLVAGLAIFFQRTKTGRALRAVADDHAAAQSVGIPISWIWFVVWLVAGLVALVAATVWGTKLGVQLVERWILARLRHQQFFSLAELNTAIATLLTTLNHRPFKKLSGSRHSQFLTYEQPALNPLPAMPYE